jgi:predicted membrane-bound dolichyl-phosphate-mannose-protein mannosyltransferase
VTEAFPKTEIITAGLKPELFGDREPVLTRKWLWALLALLVLGGLFFRAANLGAEGLSDDELNKLQAVSDYRAHGLTSANGEHPFLMKALQTASLVIIERWNHLSIVQNHPQLRASTETALRLPSIIFGSFIAILLYLFTAELFGMEVGLIAAALWAFEPSAIAFSRIGKEDIFFLFFFLLANIFWLRGQRVAESQPERNPQPYYWATAAAFGAMMASKYIPYFIAISISYNYIFQELPTTRWVIGKKRFLIFFAIMGVVFLLCNPTILLPGTWREMLAFVSYQKIGHDSYEFMGRLYQHKVMDWLNGMPWYFYFVFIGVKTSIPTLAAFLVGLPLLFRRRLGEGRFFLFFWVLFGFGPLCLVGGKFTRYFTAVLPILFIIAAIGLQFIGREVARFFAKRFAVHSMKSYPQAVLALLVIIFSIEASVSAAPYYKFYTNMIGGGRARAAYYFPQDDFYDAQVRALMFEIAGRAQAGARVASETPGLAEYYAKQANRPDLECVSLSDKAAQAELRAGDFIIAARGRRYFSNEELLTKLQQASTPAFQVFLGEIEAADVYLLDESSASMIAQNQ